MTSYTPVSPQALAERLTEQILSLDLGHPVRVALDGPSYSGLDVLAEEIGSRLALVGRVAPVVRADHFYRDASVRLEYGHEDLESFYDGWLDTDALTREVLEPAGRPDARVLPSLRDPVSNRSTRADYLTLGDGSAVLVVGELLLSHGLTFDLTVHAAISRAARRRRTDPALAWTLPAFDRYDIDVDPSSVADVTVRWDDAARPAVA